MSEKQRRQDLADFLRTRRMRLSPEEVGLKRIRRKARLATHSHH